MVAAHQRGQHVGSPAENRGETEHTHGDQRAVAARPAWPRPGPVDAVIVAHARFPPSSGRAVPPTRAPSRTAGGPRTPWSQRLGHGGSKRARRVPATESHLGDYEVALSAADC